MKKLIYIIFLLLFISCYHDEYLGINYQNTRREYKELINHVFIYDDILINDTTCQLIGTFDNISVNRQCDIYNGYIDIGTIDVFQDSVYFVYAWLNVNNKKIIIKENKKIYKYECLGLDCR